MKKLLCKLIWLKIVAVLFLCKNVTAQSFTLNGVISDKDTGIVAIRYKDANYKTCYDTTTISRGRFQFKGTVAGADYAMLDTDTSYKYGDNTYSRLVFIEPSVITISFYYGEIGKAKITGSKSQAESEAWSKSKSKEIAAIKHVSLAVDSIRGLLKSGLVDAQTAEEKLKALQKRAAPVRQLVTHKDVQYVKWNPDSYVSMMLLKYLVARVPNDSVEGLYSQLSDKVKNSSVGYDYLEYYVKYKRAIGQEYPFDKIKLNETAPGFTVYNSTDSLTLHSFKGRVVLLEFWELSCLPCLQANPLLEEIRKQYGEKEMKIIAINSTASSELPQLASYIKKNNLYKWIHVSSLNENKGTNKSVLTGDFKDYYGLGVPRSVVIDQSGKVIYKKFGYSQDDLQSIRLLIDKAVKAKED